MLGLLRCTFTRSQQRQCLEILETALRIVIEDDTRIQNIFRIENVLYAFHGLEGPASPLVLDIRSHITARSVLCLQRAIVFPDNEFADIVDHILVSANLLFRVKRLVYDKVEITLKGMTVNAGIIVSVSVKKFREIGNRFCKIFNMEGYILYQTSGSRTPHSTDCREDSRADRPISAILLRVCGEGHITISLEAFQHICNSLDLLCKFVLAFSLDHSQNGCQTLYLSGIDRCQGAFVQHLSGRHAQRTHGNDSPCGLRHILEVHHGICLQRRYLQGIHRYLAQESESSL